MNKFTCSVKMLFVALTVAAVGMFASCSDDDKEINALNPPYQLRNEIMLGNQIASVKSVVWEKDQDTDLYTFYLTPRAGVQFVDEVLRVNDFAKVEVDAPKGKIDPKTARFSVNYESLSLSNATPESDLVVFDMMAELNEESNVLNLKVLAATIEGQTLNITFNGNEKNGVRKATLPILSNQFQVKKSISKIGSVVERRHFDHTVLYLYTEKDVTTTPEEGAPSDYMMISFNKTTKGTVDFGLAPKDAYQIVYGDLDSNNAQTIEGSLKVSSNTLNQKIITLESKIDGVYVRASWKGAYFAAYESSNSISVTSVEGETATASLKKMFRANIDNTNLFYMGLNENATNLEELIEGQFALQFNVATIGKTIDLAKDNNYNLILHDYATYKSYNSRKEGIRGTLTTAYDPQGNKNLVYIRVDAEFVDGPKIACEWYGILTTVEQGDLTPVRPEQTFKIYAKNGIDVEKEVVITEVQMRENNNFQSSMSGERFPAYEFYFVNEMTAINGGVDYAEATPKIVINKEYVGKGVVDLTQKLPIFEFAYKPFNASGIASPSSWSGTTDRGTISVSQSGDNWKIEFEVLDYGDWYGWGGKSGSQKIFKVVYEGPVAAYTGRK